jgi:hypothetical protein
MVKVSLTTFLDFTAATGAGRLTQVRKAKSQSETPYSPATDYWRPLREAIREEFEDGWGGRDSLKRLRETTHDPKKQARYGECVKGLAQWSKGKQFGPSKRKTGSWVSGDLTVSVNPELVLDINGASTAVKLYFRSEKLAKPRINTLLYLLDKGLPSKSRPAVLDVPRGKLIAETVPVADLDIVLEGDAAQFITMWNRLEREAPSA